MAPTTSVEADTSFIPIDDTGNVLAKTGVGIGLGVLTVVGCWNERIAAVPGFDTLPIHIQNSVAHIGIGYLGAWAAYSAYEPTKDYLRKLGTHKTGDYFTKLVDSRLQENITDLQSVTDNSQKSRHLFGILGGLGVNLLIELAQANSSLASDKTDEIFGNYMIAENTRDAVAALAGALIAAFMARNDHLIPKLNLRKRSGN